MRPPRAARRWPRIWPAGNPGPAGRSSRWRPARPGAAAVFAFPLRIGAVRAGVLGLYRERPGPLTAFQLGDALVFADTATMLLLDAQDQAGERPRGSGRPRRPARGPGLHRAEIDQATGMLTEQLGAGIADAFVRLRAYAYALTCGWPMSPATS